MSRTYPRSGSFKRQAGVGLIEVLIAVLVLAIGFLGMARLQTQSMSTSNSAMARTMATMDTYSILDAMRSDAASARGTAYNKTVTASSCSTTTATTLSDAQLNQWCKQLGADLGASATTTGKINCDASGNCTITVQFDDSRSGAGGVSNQTLITTAML